jgi:Spy/CpxP family protein refolding chaperone
MGGLPGGVPGPNGLIPFLKLNLTQSQQKSLLDIFEKYREMRMSLMDTMMETDREMAGIRDADELDEENARAVFKKQEAVREEMMILDMKVNNEIKKVLSSEQLELLRYPVAERLERPFPLPGK